MSSNPKAGRCAHWRQFRTLDTSGGPHLGSRLQLFGSKLSREDDTDAHARRRTPLHRRGCRAPAGFGARRAHARSARRRAAALAARDARTWVRALGAHRPAARPCRWSRPASRRSTCPAGRSRPTATSPARPTRTRACTRRPARRRSCRRINNALLRADQIAHAEGDDSTHWMAPIVADAEAGFGGALNAFELMKAFIEAGAAGVHFEDQLSSEKKCGHLGGKVLVPTLAVHPHAGRRPPGRRRARRADAARSRAPTRSRRRC